MTITEAVNDALEKGEGGRYEVTIGAHQLVLLVVISNGRVLRLQVQNPVVPNDF